MLRLSLAGQRRLIYSIVLGSATIGTYWGFFSDGLPIIWGPSARASEVAQGRELFEHEWTPNDPLAHGDGLGPVFNARSCASCHFQGGLGGAGGNEHNATSFEVLPRPGDLTFINGTVHNFSTEPTLKETERKLRQLYPVIKGRTFQTGSPGCFTTTTIPDFDPVHTQSVQTTALFGAGWIDMISDRAILRNERNRGLRVAAKEMSLNFDNIPVGRARRVAGGIGKFGWKAQFATLEEFVAAACANELGLGTPSTEQVKPLTGASPPATPDLDKKQFRSLLAFVKTLPKPVAVVGDASAEHGKEVFATIGCAVCHVPDMGGVKGVYSDFLLYTLEDPPPTGGSGDYSSGPPPQLQLPERPDHEPKPNEWKTPALWGVADSAPYLHDGSAPTLRDAVMKHRGDAKSVSEKYKTLAADDQAAVLAFLGTLKAPGDAPHLSNPAVTKLDRK
ncbi:c-type cytochrome [Gemmata sp. G18]|uniref:C-type cytochrome n=1 Tax=Gemmata palustris TaxID=2822762 RepID=A0ABS5BJV5_9BACT|nr:di-heme oxidoredictase family protein [Gemmata palustris]MBP3953987.1 c-type cytochrome [Gemmata palustris]